MAGYSNIMAALDVDKSISCIPTKLFLQHNESANTIPYEYYNVIDNKYQFHWQTNPNDDICSQSITPYVVY